MSRQVIVDVYFATRRKNLKQSRDTILMFFKDPLGYVSNTIPGVERLKNAANKTR